MKGMGTAEILTRARNAFKIGLLVVLYARIPALPKFLLAVLCALAGNFSFVQGNLIWPNARCWRDCRNRPRVTTR